MAGEFQVDWGTFDWPAGFAGPITRTWSDQYGFEIDVEAELTGTFGSYQDSGGASVATPDDVDFFGGNIDSLIVIGDAPQNSGSLGDDRITATVRASSGGVAFPVDSLEIDILDIDSVDNDSTNDRCDFVTGFGNNGNPTFSTQSVTPSVLVGPGPGSGFTGNLGANEAQCIYLNGPADSPTSPNDNTGNVRATFPNSTSEAIFWYDESIQNVKNYNAVTNYNPGPRGLGMFGNVVFTVDQSINLSRSVSPNSGLEDDTITYTYIVENTGALPFNPGQDLFIEDSLLGSVSCPAITAPIAPGGTVTCSESYTVTAADVLNGSVDSSATAGIGAIGTPFVSRLQSNTENASFVTNTLVGNGDPLVCTPDRLFANTITQVAGAGSINAITTSDVFVIEDVTTDSSGNSIDMLFQITDISNASNVRVGNALLAEFVAVDNPYVQYRLRMVQDGSVTAGNLEGTPVEQSRINGVIFQQTDVDSRNATDDSSDVSGALLTPDAVSLFNLVELSSFPAPGISYVMDPTSAGDPTNWLDEPNEGNFDNFVTYEFDTFVEGEFIHGYTGSSTSIATGRGAGVYFCAISGTSTTVVAEDDDYTASPINTLLGGTAGEVMANDTVNGLPATPLNATLEVLTEAESANFGDPVPYIEVSGADAGRVIVPAGVPSGTYQIDYELCDAVDPLQCDRAKVLVSVFDGLGVDFGDAPITYLVAAHGVDSIPSVYLGAVAPDIETVAQSDATATADDLLGLDDEDGVFFPILTQGTISTLNVSVVGNGYLQAWIDFNGDGLFEETLGERAASDLQDDGTGDDNSAGDGVIQVDVVVPSDATTSTTFARFRFSSEAGLPTSSLAVDGEVEDYSLLIAAADLVDRGDAPESYGDPRHIVVPSIYLGSGLPDTEVETQHSEDADADDLNGLDDEDSIAVFPILEAGTTVSLTVQTHETLSNLYDIGVPVLTPGVTNLQVWIDWDQSGTFETTEQVAIDYRDGGTGDTDGVFNNQISLNIPVPNTIVSGFTFARVRWSTTSAVAADPFDGLNFDGEVEDYQVRLSAGAVPFICDGTLYRIVGSSSQLQKLVFTTNGPGNYSIADANVGSPAGVDYNSAWGYNALDGLFYGVDNGTLDFVRLDSLGNFDVISTIPATASVGSNAGDIMESGIMIYRVSGGGAFQLIDLSDPFNPQDLGLITYSDTFNVADFAFNPNDGMFYGINSDTDRLFYFDPLGGSSGSTSIVDFGPATFTASYGAVWFDYFGRFYINQNDTNEVLEVDVGFEGDGDGTATVIDTLTLSNENRVDAAACPSRFGPLPPEGSIRGLVYIDSNLSGNPDGPGEPGIEAVTVSAYDMNSTPDDFSDDTFISSTQTDDRGRYSLDGLSALLTYRIEVDETDPDLSGAQLTTENPYPVVRVTAGSRTRGFDFGFATSADLSLTKVALDTNAVVLTEATEGMEIDFNLTVTNDGTRATSGVQVRDLLPSGFTYVSDTASTNGDTYELGTGIWDIGDLADGASVSLTIRATMNATGEHTNVAEIVASSVDDPDSDPNTGPLTDDFADGVEDDDEASVTVAFVGGGSVLTGTVFQDNGAGSGTAYDGVQNGLEIGTTAAKVEAFNGAGTFIDSPEIAADGTWSLTLPDSFAGPVTIQVTATATHLVISETGVALPIGVNTDPRDGQFTFTPDPDEDYAGLDVGLLKQARLREDQSAVIGAGQVAELRHEFIVDAQGSVEFSVTPISETPVGGYSQALFEDSNCDGSADTVISGALTTSADQLICLVLRVSASSSIGPNASYVVQLDAVTTYGATGVSELDRNTDRLTTEASTGALRLYKTVRNITQGGTEGVRNDGVAGDVLEYRITVENPSASPASEITIYDRTPPYTELFAPIVSPSALGDMICTLIGPSSNTAGYAGNLEWDCVGTFLPGSRGNVAFQVLIAP